jgi:hypothetical protein
MTGTGYREAADVLLGSLAGGGHRPGPAGHPAYARRQLTWFRHQLPPGLELDALLPRGGAGGTGAPVVGPGAPDRRPHRIPEGMDTPTSPPPPRTEEAP